MQVNLPRLDSLTKIATIDERFKTRYSVPKINPKSLEFDPRRDAVLACRQITPLKNNKSLTGTKQYHFSKTEAGEFGRSNFGDRVESHGKISQGPSKGVLTGYDIKDSEDNGITGNRESDQSEL